ncbi:hypothetical protein CIRG_01022 [Coccidioides immitis RMSCC 2394]|uniref:Uncharacterized protein n=1 Tax=Coccidioides immitis RMSCC 2394 TaxID=404692 RepID=A0A0J6XXD6_COCIT|nr:hypothetical protein CIRG_01022 [Coccidioides immitis RMSCC 2394]
MPVQLARIYDFRSYFSDLTPEQEKYLDKLAYKIRHMNFKNLHEIKPRAKKFLKKRGQSQRVNPRGVTMAGLTPLATSKCFSHQYEISLFTISEKPDSERSYLICGSLCGTGHAGSISVTFHRGRWTRPLNVITRYMEWKA